MSQFLPRAEVIVVTTPQIAAQSVAQRAAAMSDTAPTAGHGTGGDTTKPTPENRDTRDKTNFEPAFPEEELEREEGGKTARREEE